VAGNQLHANILVNNERSMVNMGRALSVVSRPDAAASITGQGAFSTLDYRKRYSPQDLPPFKAGRMP
jgi:hypothetical protein